ncbi:MAG: trigger factor [Bacteroidetes bacterium]|nr:trigger factor [Bacteroidota bacterium]
MNLSRENTGELTATIRLEITPEDYTEQVNKVIKDYQKKANIPGFRPGHIPAGLIRKMYGKAVLAEEVNKLISESLNNYIKEQNLDMLGNPIPNQEKNSAVNFETQTSFEFFFDIGFAPEFKIPFGPETEVEDLEITVDDSMIDKYVDETRKRFGTPVKAKESGQPAESDSAAEPITEVENPVETKTPEVIPAEMTPEFFEKVYPGEKLETEELFRERIRKDAFASFAQETDRIFFNKATDILVKSTNIDLPDEFLKRWLLEYNEGKFTQEQIDKDYPSFRESMKWQLIENRIIRENEIKVSDEDIRNYIRTVMLHRVGSEFVDPEMEKKYESIVDAFMQNKEQVQRINDQLYNARMLGLFKIKLSLLKKEVSYDEFIKIASETHEHEHHDHEHSHDHEHDHNHKHEH